MRRGRARRRRRRRGRSRPAGGAVPLGTQARLDAEPWAKTAICGLLFDVGLRRDPRLCTPRIYAKCRPWRGTTGDHRPARRRHATGLSRASDRRLEATRRAVMASSRASPARATKYGQVGAWRAAGKVMVACLWRSTRPLCRSTRAFHGPAGSRVSRRIVTRSVAPMARVVPSVAGNGPAWSPPGPGGAAGSHSCRARDRPCCARARPPWAVRPVPAWPSRSRWRRRQQAGRPARQRGTCGCRRD